MPPEQDRTSLFFLLVRVFWGRRAMASVGQLRILERRLARLAAEADRMAERIGGEKNCIGRWSGSAARWMTSRTSLSARGRGEQGFGVAGSHREDAFGGLEKRRACVADWIVRVRQLVLDGARLEPRLLPVAEKTRDLRLWWERGPEQMLLIVLQARQALAEALELLRSPAAGLPVASVALSEGKDREVLLTVKEAAKLLTISAKKLYRMAALGRVPHIRLGRSVRFQREELERWIQQQTVRPLRR